VVSKILGETIITSGLVSYLNNYPGTGNIWFDGSGYGNNGMLINSPVFTSNYGGSFLLDATNDYMNVSGLPTGNVYSAFLWFFYDGQTEFQLRGHRTFFATNNFRFQWDDTSSTTVGRGPFLDFVGGGNYTPTQTLTPETLFNQWHCVGITSDGASIKIYNDGTLLNTFITNRQFSTDGNLRIAYDSISGIGSVDWFFETGGNNYIGQFFAYDREITASEVLQNYNAQKSRFGL
jgi:hypothetical protein